MEKAKEKVDRFAKISSPIIENGAWAAFSGKAAKVYAVLSFHSFPGSNGQRVAKVSIETITKEAGISRDSVSDATKEITLSGWMAVKRGGPRLKWKNIYILFEDRPHLTENILKIHKPRIHRENAGKCITKRDEKTGRFVVLPEKDRQGICRKNSGSGICREKTGNKNDIQNIQNKEAAGSALACQSQALPAYNQYVQGYVGKVLNMDDLKALFLFPGVEADLRHALTCGSINLQEGITIEMVKG